MTMSERTLRLMAAERLRPPARVSTIPAVRRGGGGDTAILGVVVRSLVEADAGRDDEEHAEHGTFPAEGFGDYVIRLKSDATQDWQVWDTEVGGVGDYVVGAEVIGSDNRKYKSLVNNNRNHNPIEDDQESPTYWEMLAEINPRHIAFPEAAVDDWRIYIPWFKIDAEVELVRRGEHFCFRQQMTRVQHGPEYSIAWNRADDRAMAVYKG